MSVFTRRHQVPCPASGWGVRPGATDREGHMVCPICAREVPAGMHPDYPGRWVALVGEHAA